MLDKMNRYWRAASHCGPHVPNSMHEGAELG